MKTFTVYYLSWSPKSGEATYSRCFDTIAEREKYRSMIEYSAASISTWEKVCRA